MNIKFALWPTNWHFCADIPRVTKITQSSNLIYIISDPINSARFNIPNLQHHHHGAAAAATVVAKHINIYRHTVYVFLIGCFD